MNNPKGKKVLLYSGGMDSWLINKLWKPDVLLYVDMKTKYSEAEKKQLPENCVIVELPLNTWEREDKIIPMRNLILASIASNYGDIICLGATAGDRVLDKTEEFASKTTELFTYLYQEQHWTEEREVSVVVPYKGYTKTQLLKEYLSKGGSVVEAWLHSLSCYEIDKWGTICLSCKPCLRKIVAFANNGFIADIVIIQDRAKYQEIINKLKESIKTENRKEEEQEILSAIKCLEKEMESWVN